MESRKRLGDWIQTYTGRAFWPLDPDPIDVCIEDIAHSLSLQCRFLGHSKCFYSIAEHSAHVAHLVPAAYTVHGLLHDAAEAYVGDMPRPIKSQPDFATLRQTERRIQESIAKALGIVWTDAARDAVRHADAVMLATEARELMIWPPPRNWNPMPEPTRDFGVIAKLHTCPNDPRDVAAGFIAAFEMLQSTTMAQVGKT